jgi:hypothetical protein
MMLFRCHWPLVEGFRAVHPHGRQVPRGSVCPAALVRKAQHAAPCFGAAAASPAGRPGAPGCLAGLGGTAADAGLLGRLCSNIDTLIKFQRCRNRGFLHVPSHYRRTVAQNPHRQGTRLWTIPEPSIRTQLQQLSVKLAARGVSIASFQRQR